MRICSNTALKFSSVAWFFSLTFTEGAASVSPIKPYGSGVWRPIRDLGAAWWVCRVIVCIVHHPLLISLFPLSIPSCNDTTQNNTGSVPDPVTVLGKKITYSFIKSPCILGTLCCSVLDGTVNMLLQLNGYRSYIFPSHHPILQNICHNKWICKKYMKVLINVTKTPIASVSMEFVI